MRRVLGRDLERDLLTAAGNPERDAAFLKGLRLNNRAVDLVVNPIERGWTGPPGLLHALHARSEPGKALAGALLFAFFDAMQLRLQQGSSEGIPYQVYLMLPYALSILALVLVARRASYPQALMKPYRKGER